MLKGKKGDDLIGFESSDRRRVEEFVFLISLDHCDGAIAVLRENICLYHSVNGLGGIVILLRLLLGFFKLAFEVLHPDLGVSLLIHYVVLLKPVGSDLGLGSTPADVRLQKIDTGTICSCTDKKKVRQVDMELIMQEVHTAYGGRILEELRDLWI